MDTAVAAEADVTSIECEGCRAVLTLPPAERAQVCPYCASPNVVVTRGTEAHPVFCIPHRGGEERARRSLAAWQRTINFFRHPGVRKAKLEQFRGVYVPAVLYGAAAHTQYSASIAEEYYVTRTRTRTVNGKTETYTERVKEHEWRPLSGHFDSWATDIIVSASAGLPNEELEAIEPFDLRQLRRYAPGLVAGWAVEAPSRNTADCVALARAEFTQNIGARLEKFMPGDGHSSLQHSSDVSQESADLTLVPLWVMALKYDDAKPALRVLVNGQTGRTWAKVPWSWPRLIGAAVLLVSLIAAVAVVIGRNS